MKTFQTIFIIFSILIILIMLFRYFFKGKFYFTSFYSEEKEYNTNGIILKKNILNALKKSGFKNKKESENRFTAITFPTMSSFSELIITDINKIDETKYIVKFNSACFFPLQVFDWGKNKRNSKRFFKNLDASS